MPPCCTGVGTWGCCGYICCCAMVGPPMSMSSRSPIRESAPGMTVGWGGWGAASAVGDGSFRLPPLKFREMYVIVFLLLHDYGWMDGSRLYSISVISGWATSWQNLLLPYANNKGADQPAHPRSLISAFVVCCLDGIIPLVFIFEISSLCLASLAVQVSLCLTWSQTPKTDFLGGRGSGLQRTWFRTLRNKNNWAAPWQNHPPSLIIVLLCTQWVAKDPIFLHADSEDSAQSDLSLHWAHMPCC